MLHKTAEIKRIVPKTDREYTGNEMISCLKEREETFHKQEEDKVGEAEGEKAGEGGQREVFNEETSKSSTTSRKRVGVKDESPKELNYWHL